MYLCFVCCGAENTHQRPVISIEDYTTNCGDADQKKVGGCTIAVRKDCNNLVKELGSMSSRCGFGRLRYHGRCELSIVNVHAPTEIAEENNKDGFYDVNVLMSSIPNQQVVIVGIDAKMELQQQSEVLARLRSDEEHCSVVVPPQTKIDIAGLNDEDCPTKSRQRVSIHVRRRIRKKLCNADSFTKFIQDAAREAVTCIP